MMLKYNEKQVYEFLIAKVSSGEFIPTRKQMCAQLSLSRGAVRDALFRLNELGLIKFDARRPRCIVLKRFSLVPNNQRPATVVMDDIAKYGGSFKL